MIEFKLYNFEHNLTSPKSFAVGPFTINVKQPHIDNLSKLRSYGKMQLSVSPDTGERVVNKRTGDQGETVETAVATIKEEDCADSILYPSVTNRKSVDDLCLILAFLTGRGVFLDDEIEEDHSKHYKTPPIVYFSTHVLKQVWDKREALVSDELVIPFFNLHLATMSSEYHSLVAYVNSVLNILYEDWYSKTGSTKHGNSKCKKEITDKARDVIIPILEANEFSKDAINDINAQLNGAIAGLFSPSAVYKTTMLIKGLGLCEEEVSSDQNKRVQWLNWVRNAIAHRGNLPTERGKGLDYDRLASVSACIATVTFCICQYYFAKQVFAVHDTMLIDLKTSLINYFNEGQFRGMKVFDELYEEYMDRLEESWREKGDYFKH